MDIKLAYILLYISPIIISIITRYEVASFSKFIICLLPIISVVPSSFVYLYIKNKDVEHIIRHAWYGISFVIGGISINWNFVIENMHNIHVFNFIIFSVFGFISLFYFTFSHILEYLGFRIYTHHGDVSILPLTLVSIVSFYNEVPDDVFIMARTAPLIIIVFVSWSTIHLVAFLDFAKNSTTRYQQQGFNLVTYSAYVTAAVFLVLVESKAQPIYFFFFALFSGVFMQFLRKHDSNIILRKNTLFVFVFTLIISSISAIVQMFIYEQPLVILHALTCLLIPNIVLARINMFLIGYRWPFINLILISLCMCVVFESLGLQVFFAWIFISNFVIALCNSVFKYEHHFDPLPQRPFIPNSLYRSFVTRKSNDSYTCFANTFSATDLGWIKKTTASETFGIDLQGLWCVTNEAAPELYYMIKAIVQDDDVFQISLRFACKPTLLTYCLKIKKIINCEVIKRSDIWYEIIIFIDIFGFTIPLSRKWCYKESSNRLVIVNNDSSYKYKLKRIAQLSKDSIIKTEYFSECVKQVDDQYFLWC